MYLDLPRLELGRSPLSRSYVLRKKSIGRFVRRILISKRIGPTQIANKVEGLERTVKHDLKGVTSGFRGSKFRFTVTRPSTC